MNLMQFNKHRCKALVLGKNSTMDKYRLRKGWMEINFAEKHLEALYMSIL